MRAVTPVFVVLFAIRALGCSGAPTDTDDTDVDTDTDADTDTDSPPPQPCLLDTDPYPGELIPVEGRGTYTPPTGGDWFCLSPMSLEDACDAFVPDYSEPGCPPVDWSVYTNWNSATGLLNGRTTTEYSRPSTIDGDYVDLFFFYENGQPTLLNIDRYLSDALWGCNNGEGGASVELLFGDATLLHPCVAALPP